MPITQTKIEDIRLKRYMGMNWTYVIKSEPEGGWFIRVYELPGCMSQGKDLLDAYNNIRDAMEGWLESAITNNYLIPTPVSDIGKERSWNSR